MATKLIQPTDQHSAAGSRLDVRLHDLLQQPGISRPTLLPLDPLGLPTPVFPLHPELLVDEPLEADVHGAPDDPYARRWAASHVLRARTNPHEWRAAAVRPRESSALIRAGHPDGPLPGCSGLFASPRYS